MCFFSNKNHLIYASKPNTIDYLQSVIENYQIFI